MKMLHQCLLCYYTGLYQGCRDKEIKAKLSQKIKYYQLKLIQKAPN